MIIVKGRSVQFEMANGRVIKPRASYGMIHDESGTIIPRNHVLVGPYEKTRKSVELDRTAQKYFGPDFDGKQAFIDRPTGTWNPVGELAQIFYERTPGSQYEGRYFHPFDRGKRWKFFGKRVQTKLSKQGSFYRIELPGNCVVNWRGFVYP